MKSLINYILETKKLSFADDYIQEGFKFGKNKMQTYSCQPKTKEELREILQKRLAKDKNADLNDIDVSEITDMSNLFHYLDPHNIDVSGWDVSNVEDMRFIFNRCEEFDADLSEWDVSRVKDMDHMFAFCYVFTGKGLENWKVSNKCTNTCSMFNNCWEFNVDLSGWNVSKVENMQEMFYNCKKFEGKGLANWDVSSVENRFAMVAGCDNLKEKPKWK